MTKKTATRGALAIGLLAAAAAAALCAVAPTDMAMDDNQPLDLDADQCPQTEAIVRDAVLAAIRSNNQLTAGLLRVFFHDCFLQGCDASVFLPGERNAVPNLSLQQPALDLIEDIRRQVHAACGGPKVSCADILALATRDAVVAAGVPRYEVHRHRMDRRQAASNVFDLPAPTDNVTQMLGKFKRQGLDNAADLVTLSGGHTIGKAGCGNIRNNDAFSSNIRATCAASRDKKQNLDVITPDKFDNKYFVALKEGHGVLFSDQVLAQDANTRALVDTYAKDERRFLEDFAASMKRLGSLKGRPEDQGKPVEIRFNCFRTNPSIELNTAVDDAVTVDEGLAASA
ncbi:hypothetical protein ACP70R_000172 [Stipagrostis hirtigluma subsp. patula]